MNATYHINSGKLTITSPTQILNAEVKVNETTFRKDIGECTSFTCDIPITNTILINNEELFVLYLETKVPKPQIVDRVPTNAIGLDLIKVSNNQLITDYGLDGSGIKVGIVDEANVYKHYEFSNNDRVKFQEVAITSDHATHCCGTVAAYGYNASAKGVAGNTDIYSYSFNNTENSLRQCGINGYNATNNSYSFIQGWDGNYYYGISYQYYLANYQSGPIKDPRFSQYSIYSRNVDQICNDYPNLFNAFAASNDRDDKYNGGTWYIYNSVSRKWVAMNPATYPPPEADGDYDSLGTEACAKNVVAVGATLDTSITTASFSNWGPTDDKRIKPELVANGVGVFSTIDTGYTAYASYSGTSMATPFVTGCAVLIQQFAKEQLGYFPKSHTVKGTLIHGANEYNSGINAKHGFGLVDMERTMIYLNQVKNSEALLVNGTMTNSKTVDTYTFNNLVDGSAVITLCYNDPYGPAQTTADSTTQVIVNRLSVYIENNGKYYYPYRLESITANAVMKTSTIYDSSLLVDWDNTQKIVALNELIGTVTVYVRRVNTLTQDQEYSLFVSNYFQNNNMGDLTGTNLNLSGDIFKTSSGNLSHNLQSNGVLEISNAYGTTTMGALNSGFSHFITNSPNFYFNKGVSINGTLQSYSGNMDIVCNSKNIMYINNSNGSVGIGPLNTSFCHFYTDRPQYYFNKTVYVNGQIRAYRQDMNLYANAKRGLSISQSTGNVGVGGNASTTHKLYIYGSAYATGGFLNFLGSHESYYEGDLKVGDVVVTTGKTKNDLAIVKIADQPNAPNVYGVVSELLDDKVVINSIGQGKATVIGPVRKGDLLTTSSQQGIAMKQETNSITNYTLAKALEDSDETKEILVHFVC